MHKTSDCTLYWLFLIGYTTGARLEEIGQALLTDVKRQGRISYIDVDDYVEDGAQDPDKEDQGDKSLKTPTSRRVVPIHDKLVKLGFDRYCDALRAAGHVRVFPDLSANSMGKRTQDASKRANRFIDRVVSKDRRLVFYSFRHGFKDLATEAGLSSRVVDQICGHAPTTVGDKYGSGVRVPALHRFLHQIEWEGIDWMALNDAAATIDWSAVASAHANKRAPR